MTQDSIKREIQIAATPERVWALITEAEPLGRWFGDAGAEVDLRLGGELAVHWAGGHTIHGVIETIDEPTRFSWRWLQPAAGDDEPLGVDRSTLVEFTLEPTADGTHLTVVESGFAALTGTKTSVAELIASHTEGWAREIAELAGDATKAAA